MNWHLPLIFLVLSSGSILLSSVGNYRYEQGVPVTVMGATLLMYVLCITTTPNTAYYVTFAAAALCYPAAAVVMYKKKNARDVMRRTFTPGFWIFVCFCLLTFLVLSSRFVMWWDELRQWSASPKWMYYHNEMFALPEASSYASMKFYPPGMACFQYFWMRLYGQFTDGHLLISFSMFMLAVMTPATQNITWKKFYMTPIMMGAILIFPMFYMANEIMVTYITLYIDPVIGVLFGYAVVSITLAKKLTPFAVANSLLALCLLPLFKDTATYLMYIAQLILVINVVFFNNLGKSFKAYFQRENLRYTLTIIGVCALLVVIPMLSKKSWGLYMDAIGRFENNFFKNVNASSVLGVLTGSGITAEQQPILGTLLKAFATKTLFGHIPGFSFLTLTLINAGLTVAAYFGAGKGDRRRVVITSALLIGGSFVFALAMVLMYYLSFTPYDALRLASFSRYLDSYMIVFPVYFIYMFGMLIVGRLRAPGIKKTRAAAIAGTVALYALYFNPWVIHFGRTFTLNRAKRNNASAKAEFIREQLDGKPRGADGKVNVYYINESSRYAGLDHHYVYYDLLDGDIFIRNVWQHMYVVSAGDADEATRQADYQTVIDRIVTQGYQYLFLDNGMLDDERFREQYGHLFTGGADSIKEYSLYRIDVAGGVPQFTYMGTFEE